MCLRAEQLEAFSQRVELAEELPPSWPPVYL